ncbi:BTB/POZ domain-containing protein 17-like, partial [Patiria miniata]|uniref:BTB/POZ domain-containing protein 17 n=1 Tax=Patiria miniata TaxID=46514 RepID=A0A914BM26_PATMI
KKVQVFFQRVGSHHLFVPDLLSHVLPQADPRTQGYRMMQAGPPGGGAAPNDIPPIQALYMAAASQLQAPITVSAKEEDTDESLPPSGKDCYGNERQTLGDMARFFNNALLSDIKLRVGFECYSAHKLILVRSSEVFERMFSSEWTDPNKMEVELVEEPECCDVFEAFLKFLYSCHIVLTVENTLPILMLADKYNVSDLRKVCINFATRSIIPKLPLKDVFHVWYQYATKCYHHCLVTSCIAALSPKADDIMSLPEWSVEWLALDIEQLTQFLKSSDLTIRNELTLFRALVKWIDSPKHPERQSKQKELLQQFIQYIRFPMMTPEQLEQLEKHRVVEQNPEMFVPYLLQAYKFNAINLEARSNNKDFTSSNFLLRNYTDLRWDKRIVLSGYSHFGRLSEVMPRFSTRSSSYPHTSWDWELKIYPKGSSTNNEDFRVVLYSNVVLDLPRPMEYMISMVNKEGVLVSVSGKKNFTKSRYTADSDLDKKVSVDELSSPNSRFLVNDNVVLQVMVKPLQ